MKLLVLFILLLAAISAMFIWLNISNFVRKHLRKQKTRKEENREILKRIGTKEIEQYLREQKLKKLR